MRLRLILLAGCAVCVHVGSEHAWGNRRMPQLGQRYPSTPGAGGPLLWRLGPPNTNSTLWLLGTHHLLPARMLPRVVPQVMRVARTIAVERAPNRAQLFRREAEGGLSERAYKVLERLLTARLARHPQLLRRFRPSVLAEIVERSIAHRPFCMDWQLCRTARARSQRVMELDPDRFFERFAGTLQQRDANAVVQLSEPLDAVDHTDPAAMMAVRDEWEALSRAVIAEFEPTERRYLAGDVEGMIAAYDRSLGQATEAERAALRVIISERNAIWWPRLVRAALHPGEVVLAVVGYRHIIAREGGLLALAREDGWTIERAPGVDERLRGSGVTVQTGDILDLAAQVLSEDP